MRSAGDYSCPSGVGQDLEDGNDSEDGDSLYSMFEFEDDDDE
jgi:hypothetical protein